MLIIWRGAGALVLLFGIISALLMNVVTSLVFNQNNYFANHAWAQAFSLWIAGAASWFTGRYLNRRPGKVLIEKATGQEVTLKPNHSLFFIKVEYWGPILFVIGVCVLFAALLRR